MKFTKFFFKWNQIGTIVPFICENNKDFILPNVYFLWLAKLALPLYAAISTVYFYTDIKVNVLLPRHRHCFHFHAMT